MRPNFLLFWTIAEREKKRARKLGGINLSERRQDTLPPNELHWQSPIASSIRPIKARPTPTSADTFGAHINYCFRVINTSRHGLRPHLPLLLPFMNIIHRITNKTHQSTAYAYICRYFWSPYQLLLPRHQYIKTPHFWSAHLSLLPPFISPTVSSISSIKARHTPTSAATFGTVANMLIMRGSKYRSRHCFLPPTIQPPLFPFLFSFFSLFFCPGPNPSFQ